MNLSDPVWWVELYLVWTFGVWVRRALLMTRSIQKYSLMPLRGWEKRAEPPKVSVIIPCRNEEKNLPILVPSLLRQDYPAVEFIFLDDRSTDGTLATLQRLTNGDPRVRILSGKPLPEGWTGKNHAMQQCADAAHGDILLFTDADTEHEPFSVSSAIRYTEDKKLDLLTLTARCVCRSFGEHLVQPMGIGCFSVWFKLEEVNDPDSQTPLCCGQYLLIRKKVYDAVGGSRAIKDAVTEDLALFKRVKAAGYPCELAIGGHVFATRMYRSLKESWIGWRRIYLHALDKDVASIVRKMLMLVIYSTLPFGVLAWGAWSWLAAGDSAWRVPTWTAAGLCGFILFLRSRSHAALKASQWSILLHPLSAMTICGILADCLRHHFTGQKVEWKAQKY